jgi:putative effector of murein hydrolase
MLLYFKNKWWHTVLCAIFILVISLIPQQQLPKPQFDSEDLMVHFFMYGGLSVCLALSLYDKIRANRYILNLFLGVLTIGMFGFSIEILQKILPFNRFFAWSDVFCNFLGASAFYFLALRLRK